MPKSSMAIGPRGPSRREPDHGVVSRMMVVSVISSVSALGFEAGCLRGAFSMSVMI